MPLLFFITPKGIITIGTKVGTKAAEFIPILGPGVEYVKKAKKVTDISDPVTASSRGIGMIFKSCFGKTAVVSAECALWLTLSVAGGLTANPALIALGAQMGNIVIDDLLE